MNPDAYEMQSWNKAQWMLDQNFPTLSTDTLDYAKIRSGVLHKTAHGLLLEAREPDEFGSIIKVHVFGGYVVIDGEFVNLLLPVNPSRMQHGQIELATTMGWFKEKLDWLLELPHHRLSPLVDRTNSPVNMHSMEAGTVRVRILMQEELDERLADNDMTQEDVDVIYRDFEVLRDAARSGDAEEHAVREFLETSGMSGLLDGEDGLFEVPDPAVLADALAGLHTIKHALASGAFADLM